MKKIELLSPVGGYSQFIAAVECGADAVYLGGTAFNARNSATNFSDEELKEVIKYAHARGVKVHLTLNILIHDKEINEAIEFAKRAYSYGVDAFIIQDLGVVNLLKEVIKDATIHFSTQGTIYSLDGVKALDEFNFERIVLSRELTLDEIEKICENSKTEIEVFVHGAMCICYSGQCRFSSLVGERSGNRGKCAQPCRLKYSLYENNKKCKTEYILSPKDLCGIYDLIRLIKSGVTSLKIEGRLKSPEYVACVTSIYRKYIDLAYELIGKGEEDKYTVDKEDIKKLEQVFNRGGFSSGYYHGRLNDKLISYNRPKHWGTYLGKVIDYDSKRKLVKVKLDADLNMGDGVEIVNETLPGNIVTYIRKDSVQVKSASLGETVYIGDITGKIRANDLIYKISDKILNNELKAISKENTYKKIPLDMKLEAITNNNLKLVITDNASNIVEYVSKYIVESAVNKPLTFDNAKSSLEKLGGTPFYLKELKVNVSSDALVPMSVLNELRREAVNMMYEKRAFSKREISNIDIRNLENNNKDIMPKLSVYLYDTSNLDGLELADRIYVPLSEYLKVKDILVDKEVIPYLNTVTKNSKYNLVGVDSVLLGNIEHLKICENVKKKYCDFSFNVFNSYTCEVLKSKYNIAGVNLSFELNLQEIKSINTDLETEVTIYGRLPLMVSEHCVIGSEVMKNNNCGLCKKNSYCIEDRTGEKFPLITQSDVCRMSVLNSKILFAGEVISELKGKIDYFRAYFFDENTNERRKVLKSLKNGEKLISDKYTLGHFYRGV